MLLWIIKFSHFSFLVFHGFILTNCHKSYLFYLFCTRLYLFIYLIPIYFYLLCYLLLSKFWWTQSHQNSRPIHSHTLPPRPMLLKKSGP